MRRWRCYRCCSSRNAARCASNRRSSLRPGRNGSRHSYRLQETMYCCSRSRAACDCSAGSGIAAEDCHGLKRWVFVPCWPLRRHRLRQPGWRARGVPVFAGPQPRAGPAQVTAGLSRLARALCEALGGMGVMTVGDCLRLPREGFTRRFGAERCSNSIGHSALARPADVLACAGTFLRRLRNDRGADRSRMLLNICHELLLSHEQFLLARQLGTQRIVSVSST